MTSKSIHRGFIDVAALPGFRVDNEPRKTLSEQLGEALDWPAVVLYGRTAFAFMVGLSGLLAAVILIGAFA